MKVTVAQINTVNGDTDGNVSQVVEAIRRAKSDGSSLVVFPELATHGYTSQDWFQDHDIVEGCLAPLEAVVGETAGITAVVGTIRPNPSAEGPRLHNCAAVISDCAIVGFADKTLLPEYDVFDDPRYFEPADTRRIFEVGGMRLGVVVCEDFWNDKTFWSERLYDLDPTEEVLRMGADIVVALNASPFNKGKTAVRRKMVAHRAASSGKPMVFVNLVGGNDGIVFDGASIVADAKGRIVLQAPSFRTHVETVQVEAEPVSEAVPGGDGIEAIRGALVLGIRDYAGKNGFSRTLLGLSGGIDSAVVAALACEALGPENVLCVMMPSPFSSAGSVSDSEELVRNLGCASRTEPITDAFETLLRQLALEKPDRGGQILSVENMQSRLRGVILMAVSNAEGRLLLSTGNKSELAVGYCTLYGDTNGGLAVLGDVLKTEVWDLARHINATAGREIIPTAVIEKRPSAELAPDQFDEDSLPPYEKLDPVLRLYFEDKCSPAEIAAAGHSEELVYEILNKVEHPSNEFKRRQLPPTIIISRNAIGIGRRRPVTHRYRRRK